MDNLTHNALLSTTSLEALTLLGTVLPVENPQIPVEMSSSLYQPLNSPVWRLLTLPTDVRRDVLTVASQPEPNPAISDLLETDIATAGGAAVLTCVLLWSTKELIQSVTKLVEACKGE